ncbi:MAG TPA: hypothetical protein VK469_04930, partial [Candidatus Kapabacteria bacterium]|nr:hypothetical protein [Candidatus Kapabacteria bacterium]
SGIILFFGSLLVLLYGFDTFTSKNYLKILVSMSNSRKIFFPLLFARIAMIFLLILFFTGSAMAIIYANGLMPPVNIYFFWFLLLLFAVLIFFFIIGTVISTFKSRILGVTALFTTWFILLFILPVIGIYILYKQADGLSSTYDIEIKKMALLSEAERMIIKKEGRFSDKNRNKPSVQALIEEYWQDDFQKIQALEKNQQEEIKHLTLKSQWVSIFIPTNFYLSTVTEISSCGYENYIDFYNYVLQKKREFVRFYFDMLYFSNQENVVSFIKGDENIFKGIIRLPATFAWGFLVLLLQISALTWWSYDRFKKLLYHLDQDELKNLEKKIAFNKSQFDIYFEDNSIYTHLLYSAFSGYGKDLLKNGYTGNITVDDSDILNQEPTQVNYMLYICNPHEFPRDIKTGDFINFLTRFLGTPNAEKKALQYEYLTPKDMHKHIGKLQAHQKGELLFTILQLRKSIIYLMGDVCKKMPFEYVSRFKKTMETLAAEGSLVLFINTEMDFPAYRTIDSPLLFHKAKHWKSHVDNRESEKK